MKAAIILAGCGVLDGSEIHESVLLYLALKQKDYDVDFYTLDSDIAKPISHLTKEVIPNPRSMLEMSARIGRGNIQSLKALEGVDYDVLAIPGGFGVATHLSDWAEKQSKCTVHKEVVRVVRDFFSLKKTIIGMCIAPMIIGRVLEGSGVKMTVGTNSDQLEILASMGIEAVSCKVNEACIDETSNIITVPAYMEPPDIAGIYESFEKVKEAL